MAAEVYSRKVGRTFHFECPRCHYRTHVSGGADHGVNCAIQTVVCRDCRQLFDVFTRLRQRPVPEAQPKRRTGLVQAGLVIPPLALIENPFRVFRAGVRPPAVGIQSRWVDVKLQCPTAAYHRIEPWNDPGHCPQCGNFLEKNNFPYRIWD